MRGPSISAKSKIHRILLNRGDDVVEKWVKVMIKLLR